MAGRKQDRDNIEHKVEETQLGGINMRKNFITEAFFFFCSLETTSREDHLCSRLPEYPGRTWRLFSLGLPALSAVFEGPSSWQEELATSLKQGDINYENYFSNPQNKSLNAGMAVIGDDP